MISLIISFESSVSFLSMEYVDSMNVFSLHCLLSPSWLLQVTMTKQHTFSPPWKRGYLTGRLFSTFPENTQPCWREENIARQFYLNMPYGLQLWMIKTWAAVVLIVLENVNNKSYVKNKDSCTWSTLFKFIKQKIDMLWRLIERKFTKKNVKTFSNHQIKILQYTSDPN